MEMCYDGALVMPQNFSVVTADEMEYIDGGLYLSKNDLVWIVSTIGANPAFVQSIVVCVKTSAMIIAGKLNFLIGPIMGIIGAAVATWVIANATTFAERTFTALMQNKGCDFTIGWEWLVVPVLEGTVR